MGYNHHREEGPAVAPPLAHYLHEAGGDGQVAIGVVGAQSSTSSSASSASS